MFSQKLNVFAVCCAALFAVAVSSSVEEELPTGIIGGKRIPISKANYIASIIIPFTPPVLLNNGVIIDNDWILTSSDNLDNKKASDLRVRVGSNHYYKDGQVIKIKKIIIHPDFKIFFRDVIALIKLEESLQWSHKIHPLPLSTSKLPAGGATGVVTGFGLTNLTAILPKELHQTKVTILNIKTCKKRYEKQGNLAVFNSRNFCTANKGKGPCGGDIGTPLVRKNKVIGIFVGELGCGSTQFPAVYADVSKYKDWIHDSITKN